MIIVLQPHSMSLERPEGVISENNQKIYTRPPLHSRISGSADAFGCNIDAVFQIDTPFLRKYGVWFRDIA